MVPGINRCSSLITELMSTAEALGDPGRQPRSAALFQAGTPSKAPWPRRPPPGHALGISPSPHRWPGSISRGGRRAPSSRNADLDPARSGLVRLSSRTETTIVRASRTYRHPEAPDRPGSRPNEKSDSDTTARAPGALAKLARRRRLKAGRPPRSGSRAQAPHRGRRPNVRRPPSRRASSPEAAWPWIQASKAAFERTSVEG